MSRRSNIADAVRSLGLAPEIEAEVLTVALDLARGSARFSSSAAEDLAWVAAGLVRRAALARGQEDILWGMAAPAIADATERGGQTS